MPLLEEKVSYNGHSKCFTSLEMTKQQAKAYSKRQAVYIRCQQPCGNKWWYFAWGKEIDADTFYNN